VSPRSASTPSSADGGDLYPLVTPDGRRWSERAAHIYRAPRAVYAPRRPLSAPYGA